MAKRKTATVNESLDFARGWQATRYERALAAEAERLRAYVEEQPCECRDEYGKPKLHQCDRCAVLNLTKAAKAAKEA